MVSYELTEEQKKKLGLAGALPNATPVSDMAPPNFNFNPTSGITPITTPSTTGMPSQADINNIGSDIGTIGTTYDPSTASVYDPMKDSYGKAAMENLGITQGKEALQTKEDVTNMGLRGSGTASNVMSELGTKQTRENALLGGQLAEQSRQGAISEAGVTGFYGGQATMQRQTAAINAQIAKAGIDVSKINLGILDVKTKADILNNAAQLGLSRDQLEATIKQQETTAMINYQSMIQQGQISMAQLAQQLKISEDELKNRMDIATMQNTTQQNQVNARVNEANQQAAAIRAAQQQAEIQYLAQQHAAVFAHSSPSSSISSGSSYVAGTGSSGFSGKYLDTAGKNIFNSKAPAKKK